MQANDKLQRILQESDAARSLPSYYRFNGLWVCLVKIANLLPRKGEEHEQIASMLRRLTREQARRVVCLRDVDALLDLDPPLEKVLGDPGERLRARKAAADLARLRERRDHDPKAALAALFEILRRIRDKREHGFKTPEGPRDEEIFAAAGSLLDAFVEVSADATSTQLMDGGARA